eukprot:TRINITY_DN15781_c1_g1_i1.p2 TRINITY_DN15781_c1_g1~~TRINITY_DN15781_c1_g1_i1.p2  ORF type:complete len:637 (-),score=283.53 TRINITY_DN15781_c1_g1_i1:149-2020(-)
MSDERAAWEKIQTKTFTKWVNSHLMKRGRKIESLETAFQDGVELINLLEVIGDSAVGKYNKKPKMRIHRIENLNRALKYIKDHDVKLASIGAEEIEEGNRKLTLGLVWTIILRFAISGLDEEGLSAKEGLLRWCQRKTEPYDNVDVKDFTMSFADGLAMCALIHRHRPDLLDYDQLTAEDPLHNLNLAFDVAEEHLDVPKLLDAEDIVGMARPDERSIMTYVAALYSVFSKLDKFETAGRRVGKLTDFAKTVMDLQNDYAQRARALVDSIGTKRGELAEGELGEDYSSAKGHINEFREYRRTTRRQFVAEQADLVALYNSIQAKRRGQGMPAYAAPEGLDLPSIEGALEQLSSVERDRRQALNANLRKLLDALRRDFADKANAFYDQLLGFRSKLADSSDSLEESLASTKANLAELQASRSAMPEIEEAEARCNAANIEENEYTDQTAEDLSFEFEQLEKAYNKQVTFFESQIAAANNQSGVSSAQMQEFRETYEHFDQDSDGVLSRLEFKSCLSSLGVVELSFEGSDKEFDTVFAKVSKDGNVVDFDSFAQYMVSITEDTASPEQLRESFKTLADGKEWVTANDLRRGQMSNEQVEYLVGAMPPHPEVEGGLDWQKFLENFC